jgi:hypothetical protein
MSTLTSLEESTLTSLQELIEDYVTDCARESIIEPLAVSFFGTLDGRIEKNDPQPYKKEQLYVWRERRGFYYYLFTLPWSEKYRTAFEVFADATSIWCFVSITREDDRDETEIPIKEFPGHDHNAGDLGRHLAEVCIDLNQKLCAVIDDESSKPDTLFRCSECQVVFTGEIGSAVSIDMITHIIEKHPMRSLAKSAGEKIKKKLKNIHKH